MIKNNYSKFYDSMFKNKDLMKDHSSCVLFLLLIKNAAYSDFKKQFKILKTNIKRGQLLMKMELIADILNMSKSTVRRKLKYLEDNKFITVERTARGLFISVLNYSKYQDEKGSQFDTSSHKKGSQFDTSEGQGVPPVTTRGVPPVTTLREKLNKREASSSASTSPATKKTEIPHIRTVKGIDIDAIIGNNNIQELWSEHCSGFKQPLIISSSRFHQWKNLIKSHGEKTCIEAMSKLGKSEFFKASDWKPDIDWFLDENNFVKIFEGKYDNTFNADGGKSNATCDRMEQL